MGPDLIIGEFVLDPLAQIAQILKKRDHLYESINIFPHIWEPLIICMNFFKKGFG